MLFEFEREFGAARLDDAAGGKDMDEIGLHIVEQALVMGDHQETAARVAQRVDAIGDRLQRGFSQRQGQQAILARRAGLGLACGSGLSLA